MLTIELDCDVCVEPRAFEQPGCREQHEAPCPEWACTRCGSAVLVNPPRARRATGRAAKSLTRSRSLAA